MGIKKMQGTPAHLEYVGPKERKYRKNCIYNNDNICYCSKAPSYMTKCVGQLHCGKFDDDKDSKEKLVIEKENLNSNYKYVLEEHDKIMKSKSKLNESLYTRKGQMGKPNEVAYDNGNLLIGKTFKLLSLRNKEEIIIYIVNLGEESSINRKYTMYSNFARALIGKKVGDEIRVKIGNGYLSYKIIGIK